MTRFDTEVHNNVVFMWEETHPSSLSHTQTFDRLIP